MPTRQKWRELKIPPIPEDRPHVLPTALCWPSRFRSHSRLILIDLVKARLSKIQMSEVKKEKKHHHKHKEKDPEKEKRRRERRERREKEGKKEKKHHHRHRNKEDKPSAPAPAPAPVQEVKKDTLLGEDVRTENIEEHFTIGRQLGTGAFSVVKVMIALAWPSS